jgi:hypothetical protein
MASAQHVILAVTETATSAALAKDRFVRISSGSVAHSSLSGLPYGVSHGSVAATTVTENRRVTINILGRLSVEASSTGTIAKGALVGVSTQAGKARTAIAAKDYAGIALTTFAAGEVGVINFMPGKLTT